MSYKDSSGRVVEQAGAKGGAFVIMVDINGNPVAGDVSTNPAANTVLGRLKDIANAIYAPKYTTVTITNLTTAAVGTNWTAFGSLACEILEVVNDTGTDLEYRRGGAGLTMIITAGQTREIRGIINANTISFKRKDSSNTQVTVRAEAFKI